MNEIACVYIIIIVTPQFRVVSCNSIAITCHSIQESDKRYLRN